jgi:hypothetical protein
MIYTISKTLQFQDKDDMADAIIGISVISPLAL